MLTEFPADEELVLALSDKKALNKSNEVSTISLAQDHSHFPHPVGQAGTFISA